MKKQIYIISLGGSLINPGEVDIDFINKFHKLILELLKQNKKFILITGGGALARKYQFALKEIGEHASDKIDWMGIYATRLNAQLTRLMFGKQANKNVIEDPNIKVTFKENILIAGGWMPGRSTDDDAVRLAKVYGATSVINLSNIDYVYTKDPRKFKDAKKIENISWKDFRKIIGDKWDPGKNVPFDPTAAKLAEKLKLKVVIANGKNLSNLKNIISGKNFQGTTIQ